MGQASRQLNKQFNKQLPAHTLIILSRNLWGITAATLVVAQALWASIWVCALVQTPPETCHIVNAALLSSLDAALSVTFKQANTHTQWSKTNPNGPTEVKAN